jgi:hypothetical protein
LAESVDIPQQRRGYIAERFAANEPLKLHEKTEEVNDVSG